MQPQPAVTTFRIPSPAHGGRSSTNYKASSSVLEGFDDVKIESAINLGSSRPPLPRRWIETGRGLNKLLEAAHMAFDQHHGLALTPDGIANILFRGFATHIGQDSEKWRGRLGIKFDGKQLIKVIKDDFVLEDADNDWESVFPEFSASIEEKMDPRLHEMIVGEYSTTGPVERLASQIVLMDTMKDFFNYAVFTRCAIPVVEIHGTSEDWIKLKERFQRVQGFDLDWWVPTVLEILDNITNKVVAREQGAENLDVEPNDDFWRHMYNYSTGSGWELMSGWLVALFPYFSNGAKNDCINWRAVRGRNGVKPANLPTSVSVVPFVWNYLGQEIQMFFYGGLMGVSFDNEKRIMRPEFGWAVCRK